MLPVGIRNSLALVNDFRRLIESSPSSSIYCFFLRRRRLVVVFLTKCVCGARHPAVVVRMARDLCSFGQNKKRENKLD